MPFSKLKSQLALQGNVVPLLVLVLLIVTGEKLWERFLPKYLEDLGASVLVIGSLGFLQNMLNAWWALQGGRWSDKLGDRRAFQLFSLLAVGGYLVAILIPHWAAVFAGMVFFSAWGAVSLPGSLSLIIKSVGKGKAAMGISMHSVIRRIPMAVGPLLGALLIGAFGMVGGIRAAFGVSAVLCLAGLFLLKNFSGKSETYEQLPFLTIWQRMDGRLKNLLFSDILIRFCEQIPYVFVVLWCINRVGVSAGQFGVLTAVEMTVAALIYIPVASFSDRMERKPFVAATFIFFTLFPVLLFYSETWPMLLLAFVVRGLKEFGEPTRKAMIVELSIEGAQARTVGAYYFIRDFTTAFAAFLGGWLWLQNPGLNLWTAAAFGAVGTVAFLFLGKGTEVED
ncbi:MAG: MFS transporter [Saprospiraceae bacterium]|nr:MAG: MFS transporter [Saprospiraceae bacterium]